MPNWCDNAVSIMGLPREIKRFMTDFTGMPVIWNEQQRADAANLEPAMCFNALLPVPPEVIEKGFSSEGYLWCVHNWGTKWDIHNSVQSAIIGSGDQVQKLFMVFETAWSQPFEFFNTIAKRYPLLIFELHSHEPGNGICAESFWVYGESMKENYEISESEVKALIDNIAELIVTENKKQTAKKKKPKWDK